VTASGSIAAVEAGGCRAELAALVAGLAGADETEVTRVAARARTLVETCPVPATLGRTVADAYRSLGYDVRVAVRSSATAVVVQHMVDAERRLLLEAARSAVSPDHR
jgi:pyruvate,water dikinase